MMRSRVTFTIGHGETTDSFQAFVEHCDDIAVTMFDDVSYEVEADVK